MKHDDNRNRCIQHESINHVGIVRYASLANIFKINRCFIVINFILNSYIKLLV